MPMLSEKARKNKIAYNVNRNKKYTKLFCARLSNDEYNQLCEYLKIVEMNKSEFIRWAFDKLREYN